jgi:N utilization substance protein A
MVTTELRGEKVDIVPFSDDPAEFVSRALQPAKVKEVQLDEERGRATVIVHDYQLSLAIGKEGQNARLAARLTGWHIDIKSESEAAAEEAHYADGEWAEGEWVEQSGEMVWKPAEGGETLSAEAWAAREATEAEAVEVAAEIVVEAVEVAEELVAEAAELAQELVAEAVEAAAEIELEAVEDFVALAASDDSEIAEDTKDS